MDVTHAFLYQEDDTPLHHLDPRAKLVLALSLVVFLWIRREVWVLLLALLPLAALIRVGRLGRGLRGLLRTYVLLGVLLVPLNALLYSLYGQAPAEPAALLSLTPAGTPLLGHLFITADGLARSVSVFLRLVLMLLAMSVFFMTTELDAIQALLLKLRVPMVLVLTLGFAFRLMPFLAEEVRRIREAQAARGLDARSGGLLRRYWKAVVPVVMPLVVSALRRALRFAEALEARATFAHPRRSQSLTLRFEGRDMAVASVAAALLGISVLLLRLQPVV